MSEKTQNSQQTLVIGLVVIAALLMAIVGVLVYQQANAIPAPTVTNQTPVGQPSPAAGGSTTGGTNGGTTGGTTGQTGAAAPVDPKSATKVPKGTEPEAFVEAYYAACEKGDWQAAFDALPADKKVGQTPDGLKEQVGGYGIKSFKVTGAQVQGDKARVDAEQVTANYGTFVNTWTFVKKDGTWYVESKAVTGMK